MPSDKVATRTAENTGLMRKRLTERAMSPKNVIMRERPLGPHDSILIFAEFSLESDEWSRYSDKRATMWDSEVDRLYTVSTKADEMPIESWSLSVRFHPLVVLTHSPGSHVLLLRR